MPVSTGVETLDEVLDGGLPENRTTLVTGTPGAGKSTLAMGFLQAGVEAGEECLYVSTEQTVEELRDSFAPFDYDLEADALTVRSVHAAPGGGDADYREGSILKSYRSGREGGGDTRARYSLRTLGEDGAGPTAGDDIALTPSNLREYLFRGIEADRVVLDSASGVRPMAADDDEFRRILLDLIRVVNDEVGATAVFTAETSSLQARGGSPNAMPVDDLLQYTVHGVVRIWREEVRGNYRRYLDVMKMRGVEHDTRRFEVTFTGDGLRVVPRDAGGGSFVVDEHLQTNIDGVDDLLGGGLLMGNGVLLQHDGQADIEPFLFAVLSGAVDQMLSVAVAPRVNTSPRFLEAMLSELGASLETLLDNDQLFVLDPLGSWYDHENVFDVSTGGQRAEAAVGTITERARGRGTVLSFTTEALVNALGETTAREFRYWVQAHALGPNDVVFDVHNPLTMRDDLSAFYLDAASQVVDTWLDDTGLQYLQLRKGPTGDVGGVRLLEGIEEPPYLRAVE